MLRFYLERDIARPINGCAVLDGFAISKVKHFVFACRDVSVESFIQILVSVHVAQESSLFAERKMKMIFENKITTFYNLTILIYTHLHTNKSVSQSVKVAFLIPGVTCTADATTHQLSAHLTISATIFHFPHLFTSSIHVFLGLPHPLLPFNLPNRMRFCNPPAHII